MSSSESSHSSKSEVSQHSEHQKETEEIQQKESSHSSKSVSSKHSKNSTDSKNSKNSKHSKHSESSTENSQEKETEKESQDKIQKETEKESENNTQIVSQTVEEPTETKKEKKEKKETKEIEMESKHENETKENEKENENENIDPTMDEEENVSEHTWKWRLGNIIIMAVGFLVVFVSYNTTQNFTTSLYDNYGMISLFVVYGCFAISGLFVPLMIRRLGEKICLCIGTICVIPFILTNIFANKIVLIIVSIFSGFGQCICWSAEGSLVTRASRPVNRGRNSGVFFFVYQLNAALGNGFAYVMTLSNLELKWLFVIFTCTCGVGIIPFILIRMKYMPKAEKGNSLLQDLKEIYGTFKTFQFLLLLPTFVYSGITQCYIYGEITYMFGVEQLSIAMCVLGFTNMIFSYFFGKISDISGRFSIFITAGLIMMVAQVGFILHFNYQFESYALLFVLVVCVGIADAGYNTQINTVLGRYFVENCDAAFSAFYSIQSLSSALGFPIFMLFGAYILTPWIYRLAQFILIGCIWCFSLVCLFFLNRKDSIELKK